jgi:cell division ATPase FtsA
MQTEESPQVCCTLWVPDSLVSHLVSQVGCSLKLVTTISKAHIAVLGLSTESGAMCKATIRSTSEEVGMALVVMGKRIA